MDGRIKSVVKTGGRSTIILREIPTDANEDEVREIFNYENCKTISSMRSDIGDTWLETIIAGVFLFNCCKLQVCGDGV